MVYVLDSYSHMFERFNYFSMVMVCDGQNGGWNVYVDMTKELGPNVIL